VLAGADIHRIEKEQVMNALPSTPRHSNIGQGIRAWWLHGQTNPAREIMGSPGYWGSTAGEPREVMAGRTEQETAELTYLMASSRQWDPTVGEPREIMSASSGANDVPLPDMMSSPGAWSVSDGGPQDVMGSGQTVRPGASVPTTVTSEPDGK
jgi:hypothetical protein